MRVEIIECKSYGTAKKQCSYGGAVICKVEAGFMCFENRDDYKIWKGQK